MKNKLVVSLAAVILSFTNLTYANTFVHSPAVSVCPGISGNWSGQGTLSNWAMTCYYHGSAHVSGADGAGRVTLSGNAIKDSGSLLCPKYVPLQLPANCNNGVATIDTHFGNVRGNVRGNAGNASGHIVISPGLEGNVSIQFRKIG